MYTYADIIVNPLILEKYKSRELIPLRCVYCGAGNTRAKHLVQSYMKRRKHNFCSVSCSSNFYKTSATEIITCKTCNEVFQQKSTTQIFCNKSCAATYNNQHKKFGTRRSKLEKWLEERIRELYPNHEIHTNNKETINSELDIYFPQLKIAFEVNGIFHYQPIFGDKKLIAIQKNDKYKQEQCALFGIQLHSIDTSGQTIFTPESSCEYLDYIIETLKIRGADRI